MKTYYVGQTPYGIYILRPKTRKNGKKYALLGEFENLKDAEKYRNEHEQLLTIQIAQAKPYIEEPKKKRKKSITSHPKQKSESIKSTVPIRITEDTWVDKEGCKHKQVSIYYNNKPTNGQVGWKDGIEFWVYTRN